MDEREYNDRVVAWVRSKWPNTTPCPMCQKNARPGPSGVPESAVGFTATNRGQRPVFNLVVELKSLTGEELAQQQFDYLAPGFEVRVEIPMRAGLSSHAGPQIRWTVAFEDVAGHRWQRSSDGKLVDLTDPRRGLPAA